jgi:hypothetical protein
MRLASCGGVWRECGRLQVSSGLGGIAGFPGAGHLSATTGGMEGFGRDQNGLNQKGDHATRWGS